MQEKLMSNRRYVSGRTTLLSIFVLSIVNMAAAFANFQFLYSSFFSNVLTQIGIGIYQETGAFFPVIICCAIGLIAIVPYLLAYIFSKKHFGWMIAGLVIASLDLVLLLGWTLLIIVTGGFYASVILDIIVHIFVEVELVLAVVGGAKAKKEPDLPAAPEEKPADVIAEDAGEACRTIKVVRAKKLYGCAFPVIVSLDGRAALVLANGKSGELKLGSGTHSLLFTYQNAEGVNVRVPEGEEDITYECSLKTGMTAASVIVRQV